MLFLAKDSRARRVYYEWHRDLIGVLVVIVLARGL